MPSRSFAPGRANLIGEHTDYNGGLALPFAIDEGITVTRADEGVGGADNPYVRGVIAELQLPEDTRFEIESTLPQGAGLSSSAALCVALVRAVQPEMKALEVAQLCQKIENEYAGAQTGLLDQLAILLGRPEQAVRIDFEKLSWDRVPLDLGDWLIVLLDSGATHEHAEGGYNERRAECQEAAELLGIEFVSQASFEDIEKLPAHLGRRVRHVLTENRRVEHTVRALKKKQTGEVAKLVNASHASLRELYEASVPEVEDTVAFARAAGAKGARMMGGGFGGVVLALFPPEADPPPGTTVVEPSAGARLV
jgi:galactokinase